MDLNDDNSVENDKAAMVAWAPDQEANDQQLAGNNGFEVRVDHYSELWIEEANLIKGKK